MMMYGTILPIKSVCSGGLSFAMPVCKSDGTSAEVSLTNPHVPPSPKVRVPEQLCPKNKQITNENRVWSGDPFH